MKIKTFIFHNVILFVVFILVSMASCSADKEFIATGTVQEIAYGKDGYTAVLKGDDGENFDAVISKISLGETYRVLAAGERVELSGDTLHIDNKLRIIVKKIN